MPGRSRRHTEDDGGRLRFAPAVFFHTLIRFMPVNVLFPVGLTGIMARFPLSWIMPAGILRQANLSKSGSPVVRFARMTSAFVSKRVGVYMRVTVFFRMCALLFLTACRSPLPDISAGPFVSGSSSVRQDPDYSGCYEVQCQVGGGDIREVCLNEGNRYVVTLANGIDVAGRFSWNAAGNMIVLERQGKPAWFFAVGENVLQKKAGDSQRNRLFRKFRQ